VCRVVDLVEVLAGVCVGWSTWLRYWLACV